MFTFTELLSENGLFFKLAVSTSPNLSLPADTFALALTLEVQKTENTNRKSFQLE